MIRLLLISGGTISLALGIIGIFIPVLPTTPFVLLSAGMYVRSSPVLYRRLMNSSLTSRYMTRKTGRWAGISSLTIMWIMIIVTELFILNSTWLRIVLIAAGVTGTVFKLRFFFGKQKIT
jgi:uncharacterized membrane protein YbaN (DUF454 family)